MTIRGTRSRERAAIEAALIAESNRSDRIDAELEAARDRVEDAIQRSADLDEDKEQADAERERVERQVRALIADARARAQEIQGIWQRQTREICLVRRARARAERLERSRREKPVPVSTAPPRTASIISRVMLPLIAIGSFFGIRRTVVVCEVENFFRPVHTKDNIPENFENMTHQEKESIRRSSEFASLSRRRSEELFGDSKVLSFVSQSFRDQGGDRTEIALDVVSPLLVLALAEPATSSRARALYAAAIVGGANPVFAAELALPALLEDAADEAERALARSLDPSIRPGDPEPDDESASGDGSYEPPPVRP